MLVLRKGIINKIVVTLREFQSVESANFLFVFTNDTTNEEIILNLADVSDNKSRYNAFCLNPDDPEVFRPGFYHYRAYQNPTNATTPEGLILCEVGRTKVVEYSTPDAYAPGNEITNVYGE